jgi:hypothetical protein
MTSGVLKGCWKRLIFMGLRRPTLARKSGGGILHPHPPPSVAEPLRRTGALSPIHQSINPPIQLNTKILLVLARLAENSERRRVLNFALSL